MDKPNGGLVLSPEFLRENKRLLIVDSQQQVKIFYVICPNSKCGNVFECSEVFTTSVSTGVMEVPAFDEPGSIQGICDKCSSGVTLNVTNPEFAAFSNGARKVNYKFEEVNDAHSAKRVVKDHSFDKYVTAYDYSARPLYTCGSCGENVETQLFEPFKLSYPQFFDAYHNSVMWNLKNAFGSNPDDILIRQEFHCQCGHHHVGFLSHKYSEFLDFEPKDFAIVNIIGAKPLEHVIESGLYSKDDCMAWLLKLLPRWTLMFESVFIVTPFIGHQWLDSKKMVDLWVGLAQKLDSSKTKIYTRGGQFKAFTKAYDELNAQSYSDLKEHGIDSTVIRELTQKMFHAKVYCGISRWGSEVLSGSANLVDGVTKEVLHFESCSDYSSALRRYLEPLEISDAIPHARVCAQLPHAIVFDSNSEFSRLQSLKETDYYSFIMSDIVPEERN